MSDKKLELESIWKYRLKLRAKASKMRIEGNRLQIEGNMLQFKSDRLWLGAILAVHGDIKVEWKNYNEEKNDYECHLENGEIYKP